MNKTEQLAYNWLIRQGYAEIVFQPNRTPDFITIQGDNFEVKKPNRKNAIEFGAIQYKALERLDNCTILVFDSKPKPLAIIPFSEIYNGKTSIANFKIKIHHLAPKKFTQTKPKLEPYLTIANASKICQVSTRTIYRFFDEGLPCIQRKTGGRVLIKSTDLTAFIEQGYGKNS